MKKTVIIFGSTTGTCEAIAEKLSSKLEGAEVLNISGSDSSKLEEYDNLLLGTSTWGDGEMQDDWYSGIEAVKSANLAGKTVAVFGCGDSQSYPDTFCAGMAEIAEAAKAAGATLIGAVSTDGYTFSGSNAVADGKFVGLAIDDINEDGKTDERINAWVSQIKSSL